MCGGESMCVRGGFTVQLAEFFEAELERLQEEGHWAPIMALPTQHDDPRRSTAKM